MNKDLDLAEVLVQVMMDKLTPEKLVGPAGNSLMNLMNIINELRKRREEDHFESEFMKWADRCSEAGWVDLNPM